VPFCDFKKKQNKTKGAATLIYLHICCATVIVGAEVERKIAADRQLETVIFYKIEEI
jgi:hypothetical protein